MPPAPTKLVFAQFARAGLANELIVLAKAYLASNALDFRLVRPPWGLNRRGYWPYFYRTPLGGLGDELARRMIPTATFSEKEYRKTGLVDYGEAVLAWATANGLMQCRPLAIECEGLWGGIIAIDRARECVRGTLLGTRFTQSNITEFLGRRNPRKLLVGVHVRRGDFAAPPAGTASFRGKWNTAIPQEWFVRVCQSLAQEFGQRAQFSVFSDASPKDLAPLIEAVDPLTTFDQRHTDCSDLLLMSLCDVLVCSPSSYSILAAWLSDRPYIWPAEQCWPEDGWLSLWGNEPAQRNGLTAANRQALSETHEVPSARGVPVPLSGVLSREFAVALSGQRVTWDRRADLLYYGVVRKPSPSG